jgi:hypothetical protein
LFTGLLDVLWEYCAFLFDQRERHVNNAVRRILKEMVATSSIASKDPDSRSFAERELIAQIKKLAEEVYHS